MKEKQLLQANLNTNNNWSKDNWKKLTISQQPQYIDTELLNEITEKVSS